MPIARKSERPAGVTNTSGEPYLELDIAGVKITTTPPTKAPPRPSSRRRAAAEAAAAAAAAVEAEEVDGDEG